VAEKRLLYRTAYLFSIQGSSARRTCKRWLQALHKLWYRKGTDEALFHLMHT